MSKQITTRQLFKAAFVANCIENGSTSPDQVLCQARESNLKVAGVLKDIFSAGKGLLSAGGAAAGTAFNTAAPLALAAPPIAGALLGGLAGRATDIDDVDVDRAKNEEIIEELRRQTQRIKRRRSAEQFAK